MTTPRYRECKDHVEQIQNAYDDLLDALDAYSDTLSRLLDGLTEEERAHLGLALRMQRDGVSRMRNDLEEKVLDDLIRFADRVIRIKHAEDDTFV